MARNEEKQQGRLNRLWLQREREEGRLKDVRVTRPKLSTLNTAASVKKWIPSIQKEIEYYLQQSQLTHYPERKIAEFQLHIEALEREYKRFITKLRVLDPTCKHKPWTPRAYCKRRADHQDPQAKKPHTKSFEGSSELTEDESGVISSWSARHKTSTSESPLRQSETTPINNAPLSLTRVNLDKDDASQDLPLSFDQTRLAVATASFRQSSAAMGSHKSNSLARVLQSGLPNLVNSALGHRTNQDCSDKNLVSLTESTQSDDRRYPVQEQKSTEKWATGAPLHAGVPTESAGHILRLGCYSSSDDEP